jgi:hypothetical protein
MGMVVARLDLRTAGALGLIGSAWGGYAFNLLVARPGIKRGTYVSESRAFRAVCSKSRSSTCVPTAFAILFPRHAQRSCPIRSPRRYLVHRVSVLDYLP